MGKTVQRLARSTAAGTRPRTRALAVAASFFLLVFGSAALWAAPASASTIDNVSLTVSNNATSATAVTYTVNFSTQTAAALTSVTFTVPAGTTAPAALTTGTAYGLAGCTVGTPTLATNTVTVPLTLCPTIAASTPVEIAVSGFTNSTTATSAFKTAVSTSAPDTGTANAGVDFNDNKTVVDVIVPESLTFTNQNPAITLLPVPGNATPATGAVKLTVATNAVNGYTLTSCVTSDIAAGSNTIPQLTSVGALNGSTTAFGAQASFVPNNGTGTDGSGTASLNAPWSTAGTDYVGYASDCAAATPNAKVISNTGTTNGDELTLTNGVSADAVQPNGTYTGTITYQVAPSY